MSQQNIGTDLSEVIAENFGANATYVEGLLSRFRSNPQLVDESWRAYFTELLGEAASADSEPSGRMAAALPHRSSLKRRSHHRLRVPPEQVPRLLPNATAPEPGCSVQTTGGEAIPIRGGALKIVENMEASLAVPTATSQRRIPVKLLDENRRIINKPSRRRTIAAKLRTRT